MHGITRTARTAGDVYLLYLASLLQMYMLENANKDLHICLRKHAYYDSGHY